MDDDAYMVKLIQSFLEVFDVSTVRSTATNEGAIKIIEGFKIDCIIVDNMSRVNNGLELTKYLRQSEIKKIKEIPIILCTAFTGLQSIFKARDAGVTEILAKPISPEQLMEKLNIALLSKRSFIDTSVFSGPDRRRRVREYPGNKDRRIANSSAANNDEKSCD